ncbi:hypothetical protein [Cyclobacterium sp. SYSU L10401]|uniref:hypothetical protein n=1 Tax=Cyclobacterium sp. SYSU L10401 TaxID=2678657 RepID=UPI0013D48764|nr:hypothetical protein [Cyclobacterium sp. SYSU L10401]
MNKDLFLKQIGKDITLKFNHVDGGTVDLIFNWLDWLKSDRNFLTISEEFRKNELSKDFQQYMIFTCKNDGYPKYKHYDNIQLYASYLATMFHENKREFVDHDFIIAYDKINDKAILVWDRMDEHPVKCQNFWDEVLNRQ